MLDVRSSLLASLLRRLLDSPKTAVDLTGTVALANDEDPVTVWVSGEVTMTVAEWRNLRAAVPGMSVARAA